jgi:predicted Fe-S protein YdhL (DUF1289 family)
VNKIAKMLLRSIQSRQAWGLCTDEQQFQFLRRIEANFSRTDLRDQELRQGAREALCELIGVEA